MPREGMSRREYRERKWGSAKAIDEMDRRMTDVGKEEGIAFALDRIERQPNTFDAHRLTWRAGREGLQDPVVDGLFRAFFLEGRDIGDRKVLADVAAAAGMDRAGAEKFLASDEGAEDVRAEEEEAHRRGVDSVPFFIIGGKYAVAGAQPPEAFLEAFEELAKPAE